MTIRNMEVEMPKRISVLKNFQYKVVISIIFMLVFSACSGGDFLSGAAGVGGCNLEGDAISIKNGRAMILADTENATVKVIRWEDSMGYWSVEGQLAARKIDPNQFRVPDNFLTTAYWFGIAGCQNWFSAQELLGSLVNDVGTSGGDPNDAPSDGDPYPGDPSGDASDSTDPTCVDSGSSGTSDCPVDDGSEGGGAYGD